MEDSVQLREGTVALVDALGFRGIWRRADPLQLVRTLHECRKRALGAISETDHAGVSIHVGAFSDNVIIAARFESEASPEEPRGNVCSSIVANIVAALQLAALDAPVPLVYRGAIARGLIYADDHFVVGEAVDAAARWMEQADGAFVWCLPDARHLYEAGRFHPLFGYAVPLKDGRRLPTQVVNPFTPLMFLQGDEQDDAIDRYEATLLATFDSLDPDVVIKRANTSSFLHEARAWTTWDFDGTRARERAERKNRDVP